MSSPSRKKATATSSSLEEEEDYYTAIERYFVGLRGSPLFIAPRDWQLIHSWLQKQIPLEVVKEGLDLAFEKRKSTRPVRGLSYCRQTVESAYRRHCEALTGSHREEEGEEVAVAAQRHLLELVSQLEKAGHAHETSHPMLYEATVGLVQRLVSLGTEQTKSIRFKDIEAELQQMDDELLSIGARSMNEEQRRRCQDEAGAALQSYQSRMPEDVYSSALQSAYRKRVRAHLGLPALSLFYI